MSQNENKSDIVGSLPADLENIKTYKLILLHKYTLGYITHYTLVLITDRETVISLQLYGHYFTLVRTVYLGGFVDPFANKPTLALLR